MKIFIDAGHGGTDSGAIGKTIIEKDFNLLIANKVISKLKEYDCNVLSSRTTDKYISLEERVNLSNKNNCDCFISIHCNSSVNIATGFESYSFTGTSSLQNNVHNEIIKVIGLKDRGKKKANFYVLKHTKAKAILLELGFINNKNDCDVLNSKIDLIVNAIVQGIVKEYNLKQKNGKYTVQLGVFNDKANAQKLVDKLKNEGYDAIIKASV